MPLTQAQAAATAGTTIYQAGSLRWRLRPGAFELLFSGSAVDFSNLDHEPRARLVKQNPLRRIYRLNLDGTEVYAKFYRAASLAQRLNWRLRGLPARREFYYLNTACALRIPAPEPLAWAQASDNQAANILITRSLGEVTSFEALVRSDNPPQGRDLSEILMAAGTLIARLHAADICHQDLHWGNILLAPAQTESAWQAYIIDLQNCAVHKYTKNGLAAWQLRNLAVTIAALRHYLKNAVILDLTGAYLRTLNDDQAVSPAAVQTHYDLLQPFADRYDKLIINRYTRRCVRNSRYAQRIKLSDGWSAQVFLQSRHSLPDSPASQACFTPEEWRSALTDPKALLEGDCLKRGNHNQVFTRELPLGERRLRVVAKHSRLRSGLRGLGQSFRPSRALRQWQIAHRLLFHQLPTPWPLAALERRRFGLLRESIFLTEYVEGTNLKHLIINGGLPAPGRTRANLLRDLALLLARLKAAGFTHRDCKISNFLVTSDNPKSKIQNNRFCLVDLDGITRRISANFRELARLGGSALEVPGLRLRDFVSFFRVFWKNSPQTRENLKKNVVKPRYFHALWKKTIRQAQRDRAHSLRRFGIQALAGQEFSNILLIKPSSLGDVVRALPVLWALRQRYPQAQITWLIRPEFAPILPGPPTLNGIIPFDRKLYGRLGRSLHATRKFLGFLRALRARDFDLVLDLQGLFRSGFFSWYSRALIRLGLANAREMAPWFYTHQIEIPAPEHILDTNWRFAQTLGAGQFPKTFPLPLPANRKSITQTLLRKAQISSAPANADTSYMVFLIGGTEASKRWSRENWITLADQLGREYDLVLVLLGAGAVETALAAELTALAPGRFTNLVGQTSLLEMATLLKEARLVAGNDSGPLHIAAALETPTVGLYGPTDPAIVGPYGQIDGVLQDASGIPRVGRYSRDPRHAMSAITVAAVLEAIKKMLAT